MLNPFMETAAHLPTGALKLSPTHHMGDQFVTQANGYGGHHYAARDFLSATGTHGTVPGQRRPVRTPQHVHVRLPLSP